MHTAEAETFYRSVTGCQVRVGVEATGNFAWFRRLLGELGHELLLGDAAAIRASNPRSQKTDKRDARHILRLLAEERFPLVWQPGLENERLRQLLLHRSSLVRMRTRVENQLDSVGKNEGLVESRRWTAKRRSAVEGLKLDGWYGERRRDLLALLDGLQERIKPLDQAVRTAAEADAQARLLMTHPGVGPVVSLAYVLTIGDWQRFPRGKQVGSYLGLIPCEDSSGDKRRLGHISKQGNPMLRWLLVQGKRSEFPS
jgi:transposase